MTILTLMAGGCEVRVFFQNGEASLKQISISPKDSVKVVVNKLFQSESSLNYFRWAFQDFAESFSYDTYVER